MTGARAQTTEFADSLVMVLGERRRRNLRAARSLAAIAALLGLCAAVDSLAAGALADGTSDWLAESHERGLLIATFCLQVALVLSGMLTAHSVLSQPPRFGVRQLAERFLGGFGLFVAMAALLGFGGILAQGPLPMPRLLVGVVAAFQICSMALYALLGPMLLRRWAWAVPVVALTVWLAVGLAVGTVPSAGPSTAVAGATGLHGLAESETLAAILTLGCCFWAGAVVACLGNLVDGHRTIVRTLVPPLAGLGALIFLPQMLTGASVGHLMLAIAIAPLADLNLPRAASEYDIGFPLLTLGWALGLVGSLLLTGEIDPVWTAVCAVVLGTPPSIALGRATTPTAEPRHRGPAAPVEDPVGR